MLTTDQIPISIAAQALLWGARSNLLNPINKNQSQCQRFFGKPLRALARLIYQLAVGIILGPCGTLYHLTMAGYTMKVSLSNNQDTDTRLLNKALSWEHLNSALSDFISIFGMRTPFFIDPNSSVGFYLSSILVKSNPIPNSLISRVLHAPKYPEMHQQNTSDMKNGYYRFDQLVFRALLIREDIGIYPSLDHHDVHALCFHSSVAGTYDF